MKDTRCSLLWSHLCISVDGYTKPCCRWNTVDGGIEQKIPSNSISQLNSDFYKGVRSTMLSGEFPRGCLSCKSAEESIKEHNLRNRSMRDSFNEKYQSYITESTEFNKLKYLEIGIDNICNLSCRMCWPNASSRLTKTFSDIGILNENYKKSEWVDLKILSQIDMSDLDRVKILGGEPLYSKRHMELLEILKTKCDRSKISLVYHTNGTVYDEDVVEEWSNYKNVHLVFSIDGYGIVNNYQRSLSDFSIIEKNLKLYKTVDNVTVSSNSVITILNVLELPKLITFLYSNEIWDYGLDFDFNRTSIIPFSDKVKEYILDSLFQKIPDKDFKYVSKMVNLKPSNTNMRSVDTILKYIAKTDNYFGIRLQHASPRMFYLLDREYKFNEYYAKT